MEAKIQGGATLWARQTVESEIFMDKPHVWFKIWFYLINRVNHARKGEFERGQCFLKYDWISKYTGATDSEIDHFIRWGKSATMLATHKARRGMVITVLKYNLYQTLDNYYSDIKSDTDGEIKATQERHSINKNDKNDKNEDNKNFNTILSSELSSQVQKIMEIFYKINPTLNWGNKTSRKSAEELIRRFGFEGTVKMAEQAISIQGQPFAPTATTPTQLKDRLAQFKIYFDREKNKQVAHKNKITIIS